MYSPLQKSKKGRSEIEKNSEKHIPAVMAELRRRPQKSQQSPTKDVPKEEYAQKMISMMNSTSRIYEQEDNENSNLLCKNS